FEIRQVPEDQHFPFHVRRFAQQLRNQQSPLVIDLHHLAVIVHPVQELLLGRIEVRHLGQLLLDPLPLLKGINLGNIPIAASDVKLPATIDFVDGALEFSRDLESSLFVHARWVIAAKHCLTVICWPAAVSSAKEAETAKNRVLEVVFLWFAGLMKLIRIRCHSRPLALWIRPLSTTFDHILRRSGWMSMDFFKAGVPI